MKEFKNDNFRTVVAVDTNVFFALVSTNENYTPKKGDKNGFYNTIRSLKRKCINGSLKIAILPQVFDEIKENLDNREREFLKEHCVFVEPKDSSKYTQKVVKVALNYIRNGVMEDENENGLPTSDAIIMAQASVVGLNLVTSNHKHFLYYSNFMHKKRREVVRTRAEDIEEINSRHGLYFEMKNGETFVPRPYSPAEYFELYRGGPFYEQGEYDEINLIQKDI